MAKLENSYLVKFLNQIQRNPYVANNLLNYIEKIEAKYSDDRLEILKMIIIKHIILENYDRSLRYREMEIIRGCIYNLDTWLVENKIVLVTDFQINTLSNERFI